MAKSFRLVAKTVVIAMSALWLLGQPASAAPRDIPVKAKNVVLVHGAFADGSSWVDVIPLLEKAGLNVVAVQNPLSSLQDDVAATKRALDRQEGPTVLVGHSWGGTVISQAGVDPKVSALVFVAALAPAIGEDLDSVTGRFPKPPVGTGLVTSDGFVGLSEKAFRTDFAQDVDPAKVPTLYAAQGWVKEGLFESRTTDAAWKSKPTFYAVSAKDRTINPDVERFFARRMDADTVELDSGHTAMLSHPREVAALILKAAGME